MLESNIRKLCLINGGWNALWKHRIEYLTINEWMPIGSHLKCPTLQNKHLQHIAKNSFALFEW